MRRRQGAKKRSGGRIWRPLPLRRLKAQRDCATVLVGDSLGIDAYQLVICFFMFDGKERYCLNGIPLSCLLNTIAQEIFVPILVAPHFIDSNGQCKTRIVKRSEERRVG